MSAMSGRLFQLTPKVFRQRDRPLAGELLADVGSRLAIDQIASHHQRYVVGTRSTAHYSRAPRGVPQSRPEQFWRLANDRDLQWP